MKKIIAILTIIGVMSLYAQEEKKFEYIANKKCKMCHKAQWKIWEGTKHAKAFETLKSEESAKIAKEMKIEDATTSEKCITCHKGWDGEEGVGCQDCHGPGSAYYKMSVMKDITAGKVKGEEVGLVKPDEELCKKCHNKESPTYKEFKAEEFFKEIAHPTPEKK